MPKDLTIYPLLIPTLYYIREALQVALETCLIGGVWVFGHVKETHTSSN